MLGLSALGAVNMGVIGLHQLGIVSHLPDPPVRGFDADRVTASPAAYLFGFPDAPVEALSLASNIPLALLARGPFGERHPSLMVLIGAKCAAEAAVSLWYLEQMRTHVRAWCAYCLLGTTINILLAASTLRPARDAWRRTPPAAGAAVGGVVVGALLLWAAGRGRDARG